MKKRKPEIPFLYIIYKQLQPLIKWKISGIELKKNEPGAFMTK